MTTADKTCILDTINKGVHLLGAVLFTYSLYYYYTYVNIPAHLNPLDEAVGGKFKYLTFCNMVIQTVFYLYAVFIDHIAVHTCSAITSESLKRSKHNFFTIFAFPLSMFITLSFWPMWFADKSLVMPMHYDLYFPSWLNHVTHAHIFIFAILEMITTYREYPSRITGLSVFIAFKLCYLVWINYIFYKSGMWVYPILAKLNLPLRVMFFTGTFFYAPFTYLAGEYFNNIYWGIHPPNKSYTTKEE
ncbi:androgen-induced gene 1 protein-like [Melanaphis sacchari]|uniref:androgen-induced gene 1 protein-like n=1 Tax=Melanaphis sacchari TaxID=742174 RepID=UPI000DC1466A|nr:androgen-induced gene 1 protein-like [Melanaphis sacchari]